MTNSLLWARHFRQFIFFLTAGAIAIALYIFVPFVLTKAAHSLIHEDPPMQADVVIALGGDSRCLRERSAAELYHQKRASAVIVSGVPYAWGIHTGEIAKRYVIHLGVPDEKIFILRESWNTRREAIDTAELMRQQRWHSAIIVTSPFHSGRARYTFRRYASDFTFHLAPLPTGPPEWEPERWWSRRGDMGYTAREFLSWANTLLGGLQ